jgi:hypothetical protein
LSAQWEHTILVTRTGYEVLTLSAADLAARTSTELGAPAPVAAAS